MRRIDLRKQKTLALPLSQIDESRKFERSPHPVPCGARIKDAAKAPLPASGKAIPVIVD
jgi:hypothetical protein